MYRLSNSPLASTVSPTPRRLGHVPSSSTKNPESTSPVASSIVTTRSHRSPGTHSCVEASWCSIIPTAADFELTDRGSAYAFVRRTLVRFEYHGLGKPDKGLVKRFLEKVTGLSRAHVTRLIRQHHRTGHIRDHGGKPPANAFPRRYTPYDAALLAEVDEAFGQLSGPATKVILWRMCHVYGDERFERLASISNGQIYNLRRTRAYRTGRLTFRKTLPTPIPIGVRRPHLRLPPSPSRPFHANNGSEYINREVADLLNKLHIPTFTKSRSRHSNDNALVESRNGSVVRSWLGHIHVPHHLVPQVNHFLRDSLCPLLNFHRPCLFPTEVTSAIGQARGPAA